MNTHHTPGPWRHEGQGDITGIENDPENGCIGLVDICAVYLRTVPGRHDANAKLIAAAPELLEACQHLLVCMRLAGWENDDSAISAKDAIAKATGDKS